MIMNWRPKKAATFFVLTLTLFFSCKKAEDEIGKSLREEGDLLGALVLDTFRIETYTFKSDSSRTNGLSASLLGDINTPEFGKVNASIYTQVRLSALTPDIDEAAMVDSLVLSFKYSSSSESRIYGYEDEIRYRIYRLTETMSIDSIYYSNSVVASDPMDLMHSSYIPSVPNTTDSVVTMLGDTLLPQMRFRLSDALAQELLDEARIGTHFGNLNDFTDYFNVLQIVAEKIGARGNIISFDLLSIDSKMALYFHVDSINGRYDFFINENSPRFVHFDQDYSGTPIEAALNSTEIGAQYGYVQSMAGLNLHYTFPTLRDLALLGGVAINKAVLSIPLTFGQDTASIAFPDRLFAVYRNDDGDIVSVPDIFEGDSFSDGFYDEEEGAYLINLTRFTQQVLNQVISEPEIMVLPTLNSTKAGMVQVFGPNGPMQQAKLKIIYTEFE